MKIDKSDFKALSHATLFNKMTITDIEETFACVDPFLKKFNKGEYIFTEGDNINSIALLIDGCAHIVRDDYWGNQTLIAQITPYNIFGEAFACLQNTPIIVNVIAQIDSTVLFLNMNKVMNICPKNCNFHTQIQQNILNDIAQKNIYLSQKIEAVTQRTTREKLLTYLSQQSKLSDSKAFKIPFNRQQLADYLAVERSAMSNEISKLVNEEIIKTCKNQFELL